MFFQVIRRKVIVSTEKDFEQPFKITLKKKAKDGRLKRNGGNLSWLLNKDCIKLSKIFVQLWLIVVSHCMVNLRKMIGIIAAVIMERV